MIKLIKEIIQVSSLKHQSHREGEQRASNNRERKGVTEYLQEQWLLFVNAKELIWGKKWYSIAQAPKFWSLQ